MFDADWILGRVAQTPDPARVRRPALLRRALLGKEIKPAWPLPGDLRRLPGRYPGDGSVLDSERPEANIPGELAQPGSKAWALAASTIDAPTVAIPLNDDARTVRLIGVFESPNSEVCVVSLDLCRIDRGRHRPSLGALADVQIFEADRETATEFLRELLEDAYLKTDPNVRDRLIRADDAVEPEVMLISAEHDVLVDVAAVAATFGMGVSFLSDNVARDIRRLEREVNAAQASLAAVVLWERDMDKLVWVGDEVARLIGRLLPRLHARQAPGPMLRAEIRALLAEAQAGTFAAAGAVTIYTCGKCQPAISRVLAEEGLSVTTVAAAPGSACLCQGLSSQNLSIALRLAVHLAGIESLLIVGWQPNFDRATAAVTNADIRHLGNAGDANAAADRADLAVIVSGSHMGHSDSGAYVDALQARGVPTARTSGNQLRDVIRAVIDHAVTRNPDLRPGS